MSKENIVEFLTRMNNQDNRCTAFPFFYQIRDWKKQLRPDGFGSEVEYYSSALECEFESEEEISQYYRDHYYEDELELRDKEKDDEIYEGDELFEEMLDVWKDSKDITEYSYELEADYKGLFLTEEDAKDHLRRNNYHYHSKADTYVQHVWRAPELEGFLGDLMDYFKIEGDNRRK